MNCNVCGKPMRLIDGNDGGVSWAYYCAIDNVKYWYSVDDSQVDYGGFEDR